MKNNRAFTLTELLIVVIVIGILAAVVLPKFGKVVETRKTTEAEEIMAAVRTEQEKRCVLGQPYANRWSELQALIPNQTTKNYHFELSDQGQGLIASSRGSYAYDLKMLSFADGRICCEGAECEKLNKEYPLCNALTDLRVDPSCVSVQTAQPLPPDPEPQPQTYNCEGSATWPCGCNGTMTRTCDTTTGQWGAWSACSAPDTCTCPDDGQGTRQDVGECGGYKTRTCNTSTGQWSNWSDVQGESTSKQEGVCGCLGNGKYNYTCVDHRWVLGDCTKINTNCCTQNLEEWVSQDGYVGPGGNSACVKKMTPCNAGTGTYSTSGISYDRAKCCKSSDKPAAGGLCNHANGSTVPCPSGRGHLLEATCAWRDNTHNSAYWDQQCQCDPSSSGTPCNGVNDPTGQRTCCEPGPVECGLCGPGGNNDVIVQPVQPVQPGHPGGLTQGDRYFSFYYTSATTCPAGQCPHDTCNRWGYKRNCHCTTAGWNCECHSY